MPFIQLCDIGKIYASEGSVAVGIRSVNLSFDKGEFVAITGQSGSGKSTLLNVISGMDTYEEGEMYVEGEPTSHFVQQDYEEYRKEYISFIFQDYNIIESFTVLQNVELALMHIDNPAQRREKALELLTRVGMEKHLRHRGSQLSGGQKQRTVIARALAKDSPVILADEPTGNLDSKTSHEILELLHEASRDKLVIVVTHNFEDVEPYATRHIRIFDGSVEFDRVLRPAQTLTTDSDKKSRTPYQNQTRGGKEHLHTLRKGLELGRVRFFSMPKLSSFICIMLIFSCLAVSLITALNGMALEEFNADRSMFVHRSGRVIILNPEERAFTDEELDALIKDTGGISHDQCDFLTDASQAESFVFTTEYQGKADIGRYPSKVNEVLLCLPLYEQTDYGKDSILVAKEKFFNLLSYDIVGIIYYVDNTVTPTAVFTSEGYDVAEGVAVAHYGSVTNAELELTNAVDSFELSINSNNIFLDFSIGEGSAYVYSKEFSSALKKFEKHKDQEGNTLPYSVSLSLASRAAEVNFSQNIYYDYYMPMPEVSPQGNGVEYGTTFDSVKLAKSPGDELTAQLYSYGIDNAICINPVTYASYQRTFYTDKNYYQSSLYYENDAEAKKAAELLISKGYNAVTSDTIISASGEDALLSYIMTFFSVFAWFVAIVFISVFLSLCTSRSMQATSSDIAILRTMGIPVKVIKISIYIQTLIAVIPAFAFTALILCVLYNIPVTNGVFTFLHAPYYLIIAIGLVLIVTMLSHRYVKRLFGTTVKKTLKGGGLK